MRSLTNVFFFTMLLFASCNTNLFESIDMDLDNVPAFVELSAHPVSKAFFSAVSLRMKADTNGGFQKVMSLINELINDNRRQIQRIRKINRRVEGECMITTHKLNDRSVFFSGQRAYFKSRGAATVEEKSEAFNIMNSRNTQRSSFDRLNSAAVASFAVESQKWQARITNAQTGISKVTAALTAINEWTPKTNVAFIQQIVKESTQMYTKVKGYPLTIPNQLIQLAANDAKIKQRLFEWLNLLKGSILEVLSESQSAYNLVQSLHNQFLITMKNLAASLSADAASLSSAIENYSTLIKVYTENEKIYTNLETQNVQLIKANTDWCNQEMANYKTNNATMEAQLKVFTDLRFWLRKNFSRVRDWLKQKYAK